MASVPAAPVIVDEQPGALHAITDRVAAGEIGKLWTVVQQRTGASGTQDNTFVTQSDLSNAVLSLTQRIDGINASTTVLSGPGGGSSSGGSQGNLLGTNNLWTGTENWGHTETFGLFPYQFSALNLGGLLTAGGAPTLQENGYQTAVDIRKSSDAKAFATLGGNAALFVQHRINASIATTNATHAGMAVSVYTQQQNVSGGINNAIAGYFSLYHDGVNVAAYGLSSTVFHVGVSGINQSHGLAVDLWRTAASGFTVGVHARCNSAGGGYKDNNYAFLASSGPGNTKKFNTGFSLGSSFTGALTCDVGLDMGWCNITTAAIIIPGNTPIVLNVLNSALVRFNPAAALFQFEAGNQLLFAIGTDGSIASKNNAFINGSLSVGGASNLAGGLSTDGLSANAATLGSLTLNGATVTSAGALIAYFTMTINGVTGHVPYYA